MQSIWRTLAALRSPTTRDAALVAAATTLVGITFGALGAGEGWPAWAVAAASVLVCAGSAQFLLVALLSAGAGLPTAIAAALLLNLRLLPLAFAARDLLPARGPARLLALHLVTDETVAFARTHGRAGMRTLAPMLFLGWNLGTVLGLALVSLVPDTAALGLDAAFPAALLALVVPALRERSTRVLALAGAAMALVAVPVTPPGVPVVLSLLALAPAAARLRRTGGATAVAPC
ncbi:AzlC family ABC transporter permease [Kineococcus gynurae]|uniref:AzlC family ABC transporter permease n=1 Tax=Kineococcus gynurae TaxID=452979 RepID=A0ABV5LMU2_9ACTN